MKKASLFLFIVAVGLFLGYSANATGFSNEFANYEITPVKDLNFGKDVEKAWTLSYGKNEKPITVIKMKTQDGVDYILRSENFEVGYKATAKGFGVFDLKNKQRTVARSISNAVLNQKEMQKQAIISPTFADDEKALGLIASYLPQLMNEGYTHLLN